MRLSVRLTLALVAAAVVPLAIAGLLWLDLGRKALEEQVRAAQRTASERIADGAGQWLGEMLSGMRLSADVFRLHRMDDEARVGALRLVYWQIEEAPIVALYDERGELVVPPVHRADDEVEDRLPASEEEVAFFHQRVPWREVLSSSEGLAVGEAYLDSRRHAVMVPIGVRIEGDADDPPWVMAAELALRPLQDMVGRLPSESIGVASLIDESGRILAHPDGARLLESYPNADLLRYADSAESRVHTIGSEEGELLAATAALRGAPWMSVVEQPTSTAFEAVRIMAERTAAVLGSSLILALLIGAILARGISRPISRASEAARAIAGGDLSRRVETSGGGEVRDLARAFNAMTEELRRSREEIESFNRELQRRVEERTEELKKAQAELLQSRKMAAIGELGAGVAHELNNPMTGILGMTQLILRKRSPDDPEVKLLRRIEEDAKRCREITMNLLRFSEQTEEVVLTEADLSEIAGSAVALQLSLLRSKGIRVETSFSSDLPKVKADPGQLQQALLNLLSNAGSATPEGGMVRVESGLEEAFVFVAVTDTGRGIPRENLDRILEPFFTTKEDWRGAGLGLSVAYRIIQSHNGTLEVESEPGEGSRFTVRLPLPADSAAPAASATG